MVETDSQNRLQVQQPNRGNLSNGGKMHHGEPNSWGDMFDPASLDRQFNQMSLVNGGHRAHVGLLPLRPPGVDF
jgi:hypothetical protein